MVLYLQSTGHPEALVWVQTQCRHHAEMLTGDCTLQAAPLQGHPSCAALHGVPLPGMLCAEGAVLSLSPCSFSEVTYLRDSALAFAPPLLHYASPANITWQSTDSISP